MVRIRKETEGGKRPGEPNTWSGIEEFESFDDAITRLSTHVNCLKGKFSSFSARHPELSFTKDTVDEFECTYVHSRSNECVYIHWWIEIQHNP